MNVILLDIDGTLVDSNDAHASAWVDALREAKRDAPFAKVRRLIGKGGDKLLKEVANIDDESPEGKAITRRRSQIFRERYLPHVKPFPQVRDLLARMRGDGYRLVVATSAREDEMKALLDRTGGAELFEQATSSDDAENSKPDPDIVQAALRRARCRPEDALMLGDTPYDIEAARAAGVDTVALRSGGWSTAELHGARAVYESAADLLQRYEDSPFARNDEPRRTPEVARARRS
jgi:HAD superfamily hydrolase (TIGR01509 family)